MKSFIPGLDSFRAGTCLFLQSCHFLSSSHLTGSPPKIQMLPGLIVSPTLGNFVTLCHDIILSALMCLQSHGESLGGYVKPCQREIRGTFLAKSYCIAALVSTLPINRLAGPQIHFFLRVCALPSSSSRLHSSFACSSF